MCSFELNEDEFNTHFNDIYNTKIYLFDSLKENKQEIEEQNRIKEMEKADILSKENNVNNFALIFLETKNVLDESFDFDKTDANTKSFLGKKRIHNKTKIEYNDNILNESNVKEKKDINLKENNNSKRGRRKKNVEYDNESNEPFHSKFKKDNVIQKIKTFTFDYILNKLNKSFKNNIYEFYPLTKEINNNLKKDFNEKLLNSTIYDIYMNSDLNKNYININDSNRKLIKKIYDEKIETETIAILEMKFRDILDYIREKDLDNFLTGFRNREIKKDNKSIDLYMEKVKKMLFQYEIWFQKKIGRNSKNS